MDEGKHRTGESMGNVSTVTTHDHSKLDEISLPLLPMIREAVFGCEAHKRTKSADTLLARDINRIV